MFNHIGITVRDKKEITGFYINVLQFRVEFNFQLNKELSETLFDIQKNTEVVELILKKTKLEIFIDDQPDFRSYAHICFNYKIPEEIYYNALHYGYKTFVQEGRTGKTYFIWDNSNNLFEIKKEQ
ncbi:MAG: hypothetical protein JXJ22_10100 [Bacteroidales bacterium]|nr:hypothetical protein [Bacteroidales bacterium]